MFDRRTLLRGSGVTALGALALGAVAGGPAQAATAPAGGAASGPELQPWHDPRRRGRPGKTVGYGFQAIVTARPGKRDRLISLLLKAPAIPHPDCLVFLVGRSSEDEDTVFLTEGWTSREDHSRFFASREAQAFVRKLQPLQAGESQILPQVPVGGKPAF